MGAPKFAVIASPRFEVFFALQAYLDPAAAPAHAAWKAAARAALPPRFDALVAGVGATPALWAGICDALQDAPAALDLAGIEAHLGGLDLVEFQRLILVGLLHDHALVARLTRGELSLAKALAAVPKVKQEWLAFVGLYPYAEDAPLAVSLNALLTAPRGFRAAVLASLRVFWDQVFAGTWAGWQARLDQSVRAAQAAFRALPLAAFAEKLALKVHVSADQKVIAAVRGGYALRVADIKRAYFLPSVFNDKRYWSAYEGKAGAVVYFPYLEPSLAAAGLAADAPDPALIFRALGDTTRFAIAGIIGRAPTTSVELARILAVSKPTISHHIQIMRTAGLIAETHDRGGVALSLRRDLVERLSGLALAAFHQQPGGGET